MPSSFTSSRIYVNYKNNNFLGPVILTTYCSNRYTSIGRLNVRMAINIFNAASVIHEAVLS